MNRTRSRSPKLVKLWRELKRETRKAASDSCIIGRVSQTSAARPALKGHTVTILNRIIIVKRTSRRITFLVKIWEERAY